MGGFADLKGNVGQYLFMFAAGWVLGAFAEEVAFRGYIMERTAGLFTNRTAGLTAAVVLSSVLFGLIHMAGYRRRCRATLGCCVFSILRLNWRQHLGSVLSHGFNNTIGLRCFLQAALLALVTQRQF
jgi:membrane protease YdiL (CAAX protease family)